MSKPNPTSRQTFTAVIQREGAFTFVAVPFAPSEPWGARPRYHVTGTIEGRPVRGCLGSQDSAYFLRLGAAWLRDCGIGPGDAVTVVLEPEGPQEATVAPDIATAFAADAIARAFFEGLPTFYRKNFMRWIDSAKRPETRAKRIAEMMALLAAGKRER